jgi:hypothetical protein
MLITNRDVYFIMANTGMQQENPLNIPSLHYAPGKVSISVLFFSSKAGNGESSSR